MKSRTKYEFSIFSIKSAYSYLKWIGVIYVIYPILQVENMSLWYIWYILSFKWKCVCMSVRISQDSDAGLHSWTQSSYSSKYNESFHSLCLVYFHSFAICTRLGIINLKTYLAVSIYYLVYMYSIIEYL